MTIRSGSGWDGVQGRAPGLSPGECGDADDKTIVVTDRRRL